MGNFKYKGQDAISQDGLGIDIIIHAGRGKGLGQGGNLELQTSPRGPVTSSVINTPITRGLIVADRKLLTDNTVIGLFEITLASGEMIGGGMNYTIFCTDATDFQAHSGVLTFAANNKGGVITAVINESAQLESAALSAGSLTDTWSIVGSGGIKIIVELNANTSFAANTRLDIYFQIYLNGITGNVTLL